MGWKRPPWKLYGHSLLTGVLAGGVVVGYRILLDRISAYRTAMQGLLLGWVAVLFLCSFGIGWLIHKYPMIRGSGIPQLKGVLLRKMEFHWFPELIAKFIGGIAAIGCGLSLGREGPSIQMGAYVGDGVSAVSKYTHSERRYLLTAGASAGLAAAFNAPLAGVLFAVEELHKNISPRMLTCSFLGSIGGEVVSKYVFGLQPIFNFHLFSYLPVSKYPILIGLGILCGIGGVLFTRALLFALDIHDRYIRNDLFRPLPILLLAGVLGLFLPQVLGGGHELILSSTGEQYGAQFLLLILVGKFIFTSLSYGTGAPGGIFFPLLVIGALLGRLYSDMLVQFFSWDYEYKINFIILGMTAFFSAVVQAPITGSILLAEMVGSLQHFTSLVTVSAVAYISAELFHTRPIYEVFLYRLLRTRTPHNLQNQYPTSSHRPNL